mgnify:CR=1 FL=1
MKRLSRVSFLFILMLIMVIMSMYRFNPVHAQMNIEEISSSEQKAVKKVIENLVEAIRTYDPDQYIALFHKKSPIYVLHYSDLKETFRILSSYDLVYEIENIRFIQKKDEDVTVEVDIIVKSHNSEEYTDRRNTFQYILKSEENQYKIYDMSVKSIEALGQKDQSNTILAKKRLYYADGSLAYEGVMENGKPHGRGIRYYKDGKIMYEGTFKDGKISGTGIFYDASGKKVYEGEVENGRLSGHGNSYYPNGRIFYSGYWKDGVFDGRGKIYYENGKVMYMGEFVEGRATGQGKAYYDNGIIQYEGEMKDDYSHGKGIEYYKNGQIMYEGEFANGVPHGEGTKYDEEGKIIFKGQWEKGEPVQPEK